jgi:hypothetical protein
MAVTLKATGPTFFGAVRGKVTLVPPPAAAVKGARAFAGSIPYSASRLSPVAGSTTSSWTEPFSSASEALLTTTSRRARSLSRRKRGT